VIILLVVFWQFKTISYGFLPEVDSSTLQGYTRAVQGISFDSMKQHQEEVNKVLLHDPNSKGFFSTIGLVGGGGNSGFIFLHLKTPGERPEIPSAKMLALDRKYGGVPVIGSILRGHAAFRAPSRYQR